VVTADAGGNYASEAPFNFSSIVGNFVREQASLSFLTKISSFEFIIH